MSTLHEWHDRNSVVRRCLDSLNDTPTLNAVLLEGIVQPSPQWPHRKASISALLQCGWSWPGPTQPSSIRHTKGSTVPPCSPLFTKNQTNIKSISFHALFELQNLDLKQKNKNSNVSTVSEFVIQNFDFLFLQSISCSSSLESSTHDIV